MMKQNLLFALVAVLCWSCADDEGCDTRQGVFLKTDIDTPQDLFIELVDGNGQNLIANGIYSASEITIERNGSVVTGVVFQDIEPIKDLILINTTGDEGNNEIFINLNATERDTLMMNLEVVSMDACTGPSFELKQVTYNGVVKTVTQSENLQKITVVK